MSNPTMTREQAEAHAIGDPTLRSMLDKGLPLDREMYIAMCYGSDTPEDWNHEHEAELPEPLRDPSSVRRPPRLASAANHQD